MKIALLGYGKMGKAIEAYCSEQTNHSIVAKLDTTNEEAFSVDFLKDADVAIEFSRPEAAVNHILTCFEANVPVVCGTTGWLEGWESVETACKNKQGGFFYSSNFSVGVNLFWKVIEHAGQLLNERDYHAKIDETHHVHKLDAPSGTAITTAEKLLKQLQQYKKWQLDETNAHDVLPIIAHREGEVPGTHLVTFENEIDVISIEHRAKSRLGFVTAAVKAAEFMHGKTGMFGMDDLLK